MCGIVGYVASENISDKARDVIIEGLARLEYRGYDSAGIALVEDSSIYCQKKEGRLDNLRSIISSHSSSARAGIGHTRWATHGGPTDENAHPHVSFDKRVALVHNGIIENYKDLANELAQKNILSLSETDSEVAVHHLALELEKDNDLFEAMRRLACKLEGSFTLVAIDSHNDGEIVAARRNSPLVVGIGEGAYYLGSDVAAFVGETRKALELGQDTVVRITPTDVDVVKFDGSKTQGTPFEVDWDLDAAGKGNFDTFMDKEIHEEPAAVRKTLTSRVDSANRLVLDELRIDESLLREVNRIIVVACGTASYAGHVAKYALEQWCRIPVEVELAHEFRYRECIVNEKTLVVAISQSGETMDTLMAIRHARENSSKVLAIVNTYGSTIARESDAVLYTHAGPEVAVASTKAFVAQITACYILGLYLAQVRECVSSETITNTLEELNKMPGRIEDVLACEDAVRSLARSMADVQSVLFLGRHVGFPVALEGALKLKELAYIHAEGFAAGELKHGPIALVEEDMPIFVIVPPVSEDVIHSKVISNVQEVRARGARVIAVAEENDLAVGNFVDEEYIVRVPSGVHALMMPLVTVIPLQIFACELARVKGYDVDKPRNLAKSVTVE
ncbi:MAG: glutamine--fructose-6-phosphate transaminase (isomerizing) [Actinomycetaceae bacterium]|nr:glutamine--fructose-6-phosphate transaminase (isomerizing) [Actinomycetaceae bacterium]